MQKFDLNDDSAKDVIQSVLNIMFGVARTYSKLDHINLDIKIEFMEKGFRWYEKLRDYFKETKNGKWAAKIPDLEDQMHICEEMVELLPRRISQVNAERLS